MKKDKKIMAVGILGHGEIGKAIGRICREAGFKIFIRELDYDQFKDEKIDILHVSIPEKSNNKFVNIVVKAMKEFKPVLTVINSSVTLGTTRKIYEKTGLAIVHSPVIGVHPHLYESIKRYFKKVVGPVNKKSLNLAIKHFKKLRIRFAVYDSPEDSEAAKLLDLVYYAWNIVFCKWMKETATANKLNFDQIYGRQNQIYNQGYSKLRPNVVRPILQPVPGAIGGHCTIPDTVIFDKYFPNRFTKFILKENERYKKEKK